MKRGWLYVALAIVVLAGVYARFTVFTSLTRYRELALSAARGHGISADEWAGLPHRFHHGDGDCLRYPAPAQAESPAQAALDANLTPDEVSGLLAVFLDLADAHEDQAHSRSALQEGAELAREHNQLGWHDRIVFALNQGKLRELDREQRVRTHAEAERELAQLPFEKRRTIATLFERHMLAFTFTNFPAVLTQMRRNVTERRLDTLGRTLSSSAAHTGKLPADAKAFAELVPDAKARRDGWEAEIAYQRTATGAQLTSLGADLKPGGSGLDEDLVRRVAFTPGSAPSTFTVSRKDLDAVISGSHSVSADAVVAPSLGLRGLMEGLRINGIKPRTVFAQAGLLNDDVILAVNGEPVDTPEHVLAVYQAVKGATEAVVDVRRQGALRSLRVVAK